MIRVNAIKKGPKTFKKRIASRKSTTRGRSEWKLDLKKDRGIVQELTCDDDKKATSKKRKRTNIYLLNSFHRGPRNKSIDYFARK